MLKPLQVNSENFRVLCDPYLQSSVLRIPLAPYAEIVLQLFLCEEKVKTVEESGVLRPRHDHRH